MGLDQYDLAYSRHLARSLRLYGSSSSAAAAAAHITTTTSQIIGMIPTAIAESSTITLASGASGIKLDDNPSFYTAVGRHFMLYYISPFIARLWTLFWWIVLPLLILWSFYTLFMRYMPNAQAILDRQPVYIQYRQIKQHLPEDWARAWLNLKENFIWDFAHRYYYRIWNFVESHWARVFFSLIALGFALKFASFFVKENPLDFRGKGFFVPDYMAWGRKEEGSNHVGQYRGGQDGRTQKRIERPKGDLVYGKEYENVNDWPAGSFADDEDVEFERQIFGGTARSTSTWITTTTTTGERALAEEKTSSEAQRAVEPIVTTSISESVPSVRWWFPSYSYESGSSEVEQDETTTTSLPLSQIETSSEVEIAPETSATSSSKESVSSAASSSESDRSAIEHSETTTTTSSLTETKTSSEADTAFEPSTTTESSERIPPAILPPGGDLLEQQENRTAGDGRYDEDGMAWCSICGQRHCCEVF